MTACEAIAARTSCRSYRPDPVPQAVLETLLEAMRLAPSACNRQPWRIAVVREESARQQVFAEGFLPGLGMRWALDAPVFVVIGMELSLVPHRLGAAISGVDYPWIDIGIAGEHLVLAATEQGLGSCWIGWIRPAPLAKVVGWPKSVLPAAVITLGYPRNPVPPGPTARRRKPLDEIVRWL
jgi:nitroreductase